MSLSAAHFSNAREALLKAGSSAEAILTALEEVNRVELLWLASTRNDAWAQGLRGDGLAKADGFTETLTGILRRFAAKGEVTHAEIGPELPRHISDIRRRLKKRNSSIIIDTLVGVGYRLTAGLDELFQMLRGRASTSIRAPGYTEKETTILALFQTRGSLHVDQMPTLQRYVSKLRAKLPKDAEIVTAGEGLYTVDDRSRARLAEVLVSGRDEPAPVKRPNVQALPKPKPKRTRRLEEGAALAA